MIPSRCGPVRRIRLANVPRMHYSKTSATSHAIRSGSFSLATVLKYWVKAFSRTSEVENSLEEGWTCQSNTSRLDTAIALVAGSGRRLGKRAGVDGSSTCNAAGIGPRAVVGGWNRNTELAPS